MSAVTPIGCSVYEGYGATVRRESEATALCSLVADFFLVCAQETGVIAHNQQVRDDVQVFTQAPIVSPSLFC